MFSCGTGITPFYSMIQNLSIKTKYNIKLYSSFKSQDQSFLFEKLNHSSLSKYAYYSSESNKLSPDKIDSILDNKLLENYIVFICGNESYNELIMNKCLKFNIEYVVF
jgi:ferredoxin-NADP reductase